MSSRLITTWSAYDSAVQDILDLAPDTLQIFDQDLSTLKLERPERSAALRRLLSLRHDDTRWSRRLTIVVQKPDFVRQYSPQLMTLLSRHAPTLTIIHAPAHLATLSDSLLIADGRHALLRFHHDHARSRLIIDDSGECAPLQQRFDEIVGEGGEALSASTLGL